MAGRLCAGLGITKVEAMSSRRPYRPALGVAAALQELEAGTATHYDGAVVGACVQLFRQGRFAFPVT